MKRYWHVSVLCSALLFFSKAHTQSLFSFRSGMWVNLHHFLYQQALAPDTTLFSSLPNNEQVQWVNGINYYKSNLANKDLLFDTSMVKIKNMLEDVEVDKAIHGELSSPELVDILNTLSISYRAHFWKYQDSTNKAWIRQTVFLINQYGKAISMQLERLYLTKWPTDTLKVDVTGFASWAGAYTTIDPNRITVSSVDTSNAQEAALEIVFHEASHVLIDSVRAKISAICKRDNKLLPRRDLWHAILFYTTGEVVRMHIAGYTPYAYKNGLWKKAWPMYITWLEKDWLPYIKGEETFDNAVNQLAKDVEVEK